MHNLTEEEALALADQYPVGITPKLVKNIILAAGESEWYLLAKQWIENPLPIGGLTFPRACQFIVDVVDNGWDPLKALPDPLPNNAKPEIALAIEKILLGNFKAILDSGDAYEPSIAVRTGLDVFMEIIVGPVATRGAYRLIMPHLCTEYSSSADFVASLLACDEKIQGLLEDKIGP